MKPLGWQQSFSGFGLAGRPSDLKQATTVIQSSPAVMQHVYARRPPSLVEDPEQKGLDGTSDETKHLYFQIKSEWLRLGLNDVCLGESDFKAKVYEFGININQFNPSSEEVDKALLLFCSINSNPTLREAICQMDSAINLKRLSTRIDHGLGGNKFEFGRQYFAFKGECDQLALRMGFSHGQAYIAFQEFTLKLIEAGKSQFIDTPRLNRTDVEYLQALELASSCLDREIKVISVERNLNDLFTKLRSNDLQVRHYASRFTVDEVSSGIHLFLREDFVSKGELLIASISLETEVGMGAIDGEMKADLAKDPSVEDIKCIVMDDDLVHAIRAGEIPSFTADLDPEIVAKIVTRKEFEETFLLDYPMKERILSEASVPMAQSPIAKVLDDHFNLAAIGTTIIIPDRVDFNINETVSDGPLIALSKYDGQNVLTISISPAQEGILLDHGKQDPKSMADLSKSLIAGMRSKMTLLYQPFITEESGTHCHFESFGNSYQIPNNVRKIIDNFLDLRCIGSYLESDASYDFAELMLHLSQICESSQIDDSEFRDPISHHQHRYESVRNGLLDRFGEDFTRLESILGIEIESDRPFAQIDRELTNTIRHYCISFPNGQKEESSSGAVRNQIDSQPFKEAVRGINGNDNGGEQSFLICNVYSDNANFKLPVGKQFMLCVDDPVPGPRSSDYSVHQHLNIVLAMDVVRSGRLDESLLRRINDTVMQWIENYSKSGP